MDRQTFTCVSCDKVSFELHYPVTVVYCAAKGRRRKLKSLGPHVDFTMGTRPKWCPLNETEVPS